MVDTASSAYPTLILDSDGQPMVRIGGPTRPVPVGYARSYYRALLSSLDIEEDDELCHD